MNEIFETEVYAPVDKPWGGYQDLERTEAWTVKRVWVNNGGILSLQSHKLRAEHWVVASGVATVTLDDKIFDLTVGESVFIPIGAVHRMANNHADTLQIIETQIGVGDETDIVRYEDEYGREGTNT